jgi:hypothetical protein
MATLKQDVKLNGIEQRDLIALLTNLTAAVNALITDHNTLRTKLNADAGVTDANYAASTASTVSMSRS